ncbi:MAG: glycosyltransferase family 2 protein [Candidatus Delongbacteria bacterium]|nr:glycosyltransferase family 2 protein [Candidatus Delongbacteria bacterium]
MKLSIVTTLYYSAPYLREFYSRCRTAVSALTDDYEMILVNDGSPDESLEIAIELSRSDDRIRVIDLSRNFGHHKAIQTGLSFAEGDYVFLIDCDLEEEPELLSLFWKTLHDRKADLVFGIQEHRKGRWFERISGALFYRLFNLFSDLPVKENLMTIRLMTRRYQKNLVRFMETHPVYFGLAALTGFTQYSISIAKKDKGKTTYNLYKKLALMVNAITSFSSKPLVYIFYLGLWIVIISSGWIIRLLIRKWFYQVPMGWTSIVVSIWLFGGLTLFAIGIVGVYLAKIFEQTKQRPYVVIRQLWEKGEGRDVF